MRKLIIDQGLFAMAFERDVDYDEQYSLNAYLDLETGDVEWLYDEDHDAEMYGLTAADNRMQWKRIEAEPNRFLLIPGLSHSEHHEILQKFLTSDWTDDEDLRQTAHAAYFGSIGGWKKTVNNEDVVRAYFESRDQQIIEFAERFLLENGIEPDWT